MKAKDFGTMMEEEVKTLTKEIISEWVAKDLKDLIIDSVDIENNTGSCNVDNIPNNMDQKEFIRCMKELGFKVNIHESEMFICWK